MKKMLSLMLVVILVLSIVTIASAAITIGGNVRVWYEDLSDDGANKQLSTFKFDRLAIDVNADLSENSGIKSEVQFRTIRTDKEATDIRVDFAYFYQKGLWLSNAEFNIGAFNAMPFKNGYSNAMISGGLGDALKIGNSVGMTYSINNPSCNFAIGLCNALANASSNSTNPTDVSQANDPEGFNYTARFNWLPFSGLKVGLGYEHVAVLTNSTTGASVGDAANNYLTNMVVDVSYNNANVPYSGMIEYASVTPTLNGTSQDTLTGVYGEGAYNFGSFKVYAGRGINLTSTSADAGVYGNNIYTKAANPFFAGGANIFNVKNDYTTVGITVPVTSAVTLQGEYVMVDDDSKLAISGQKELGIRLLIKF
jgi:hypothetical protein